MASVYSAVWGSQGNSPRIRLDYSVSYPSNTTATVSWALYYVASLAVSSKTAKSYSVVIGGVTRASSTFSINGKTGTNSITSGSFNVDRGTAASSLSAYASMGIKVTWNKEYKETITTDTGSMSIAAKPSYTISYNANGGSGAPGAQTKWYGTALALSSTKPTRTGYVFLGWSTSASATSAIYAAGGTYSTEAAATLYAVWSPNTLTINYYSNGADYCVIAGTGVTATNNIQIATGTLKYGTTYTDAINSYATSDGSCYMTKTNYNALGYWNTAADGSGIAIDENYGGTGQAVAEALGKSLNSGNASVNLYAQWELGIVRLQYNANGGLGAPEGVSVIAGEVVTVSTATPTREGYTFKGWGVSKDTTTISYSGGESFELDGNLSLYAIWEANKYSAKIQLSESSFTTIYYQYDIPIYYADSNYTRKITSIAPPNRKFKVFKGLYAENGEQQLGALLLSIDGVIQDALCSYVFEGNIVPEVCYYWIPSEIKFLEDQVCLANDFIEGTSSVKMGYGGIMYAPEFVEGVEQISIKSDNKIAIASIRHKTFK